MILRDWYGDTVEVEMPDETGGVVVSVCEDARHADVMLTPSQAIALAGGLVSAAWRAAAEKRKADA